MLNFLINGKDYVVPLVVEEPSIVAALSSAAKIARSGGGFESRAAQPILIGQVQVVKVPHMQRARARLLQKKDQILNLANSLHPKMVARGGGALDIEVITHPTGNDLGDMLVVHLLVDTRDAMGANLVNTMCEGVASLVEKISGGKVFLRILSNLADRSLVKTKVTIPLQALSGRRGWDAEQVRDGIIIASEFARVDPYRAATHNKGIMNGVDAVALATGNDWRALEAGAHAYAARGPSYTALTTWQKTAAGDLEGTLAMPIKVGTVGGPLQSNPTVAVNLRLIGAESARELAGVMGAVGLAQNFAALRALATDGIQKGHMTLHARSVAVAAGASAEIFDTVVERLVNSGEIKIWKARQLVQEVRAQLSTVAAAEPQTLAGGHGKVILLGEHSVVYGRLAIAAPVPLAVQARITDADKGVRLSVPLWGLDHQLETDPGKRQSFEKPAALVLERLGLADRSMRIEVFPTVPRAMGLGGSAAIAVAIIHALNTRYALGLSLDEVNALAYESEKIAHGNPSGIDNTVATFGECLVYRRGEPPLIEPLKVGRKIPLVIGLSGVEGLTAATVSRVRRAWEKAPARYDRIFDEIDQLAEAGRGAIERGDLEQLGDLMNINQGLLNALQVSCWELEELIQIARDNGALGAKLTGGGGGGSMIAVCPDNAERVRKAMEEAGYQSLEVSIG